MTRGVRRYARGHMARASRRSQELSRWYLLSEDNALSARLRAKLETASLRRNTRRVQRLNGRHEGATIFIVGSGPQLGSLTAQQRATLSADAVTIGVNRTQYAIRLRYFLSAYPAEVLLARLRCPTACALHMRRAYEAPVIRGALTVGRRPFKPGAGLPVRFDDTDAPTLLTLRNVALGATHLAVILGARR